ncbi:hypothetical protein B5E58_06090 [Tyzzerella sp. An114]|uniref:polyphosphate polymerase domain-containing protein n=1 Tax=Tyzzerella sp. An114 TaxID=1965545 RepID=UPI000B43824A|nr:polyphosphate polymerase domain-containing protein [Tyzzerella sp. An114]OUQ58750.1 hypothetical protein B5E58_06090 [Tyzzerella sp. An114]
MGYKNTFERFEIKFILNLNQYNEIKNVLYKYMKGDEYGNSTICNVYYDTPDKLIIRRSLEKPVYKEKLRVRSYGVSDKNNNVFVELKKKYKGIVYKRRTEMTLQQSELYLGGDINFEKSSQIMNEIDYFIKFYKNIEPSIFISYEREAFFGKYDDSFRITFDRNIIWRDYDISLDKGVYGNKLIDENTVLMEVKTSEGIPLWLLKILSRNHIYKTSFSKYGNAYKYIINNNLKGGTKIA